MKTVKLRIFVNAFFALLIASQPSLSAEQGVTVYKSPTCGCCTGWVDYLQDNGLQVKIIDLQDLDPIKKKYGVSRQLQSCHTALVDGYVIEGHVPVDDIRRLVKEQPEITGLTAPGMPPMSPGMASLKPKGYDVLSFDRKGKTEIYSSY